jgi:DNA repair protein RadD
VIDLRWYQSGAIERSHVAVACGHRRILIVAPTGAGKTTIAAAMVDRVLERGRRALFVAHRKELIDQASARLDSIGVDHGVIMAGHRRHRPDEPMQVASVQTLVRREAPDADVVIIDEAHRAAAKSYRQILKHYPEAIVIGLTATPYRADGAPLGGVFSTFVEAVGVDQLVRDGWLVEPTIFAPTAPDLDGVRVDRGDYRTSDLDRVMGSGQVIGDIVDHWRRVVVRGRTAVFAVSVAHSQRLTDAFIDADIAAEHVDGKTPRAEREAILGRLATGETQVLCNVGILTEGWDLPDLEAVVLARPTRSEGLFRQMVGRVLRPAPRKQQALVMDHAGATLSFGWPTAPQTFSLTASEGRGKRRAPPATIRQCPKCYAIAKPAPVCAWCGHHFAPRPVDVFEAAGELGKLDRDQVAPKPTKPPAPHLVASFGEIDMQREASGYKPGWSLFRFRQRWGFFPSKAVIQAVRDR